MPAILHPGEVEQRPTRRYDEGDSGGGRRPPIDEKHTGGGGDNDNWNNQPQGRRGPRERLQRYRLGIFFALGGDALFFVSIVSAFFVTKHSGHVNANYQWVNSWLPIQIPSILWINTAVLLLSSVSVELARRAMFRESDLMEEWLGIGTPTRKRVLPWLAVSVLLGGLFVWGQLTAWSQLKMQRATFRDNPSTHFFYLITGVHGVHLLLGMAFLTAALVGMRAMRSLESRQILVDCSAWYWHSMGVFWVFLFALLVYGQ